MKQEILFSADELLTMMSDKAFKRLALPDNTVYWFKASYEVEGGEIDFVRLIISDIEPE